MSGSISQPGARFGASRPDATRCILEIWDPIPGSVPEGNGDGEVPADYGYVALAVSCVACPTAVKVTGWVGSASVAVKRPSTPA